MKKRVLSAILSIAMLLSVFSIAVFAEESAQGVAQTDKQSIAPLTGIEDPAVIEQFAEAYADTAAQRTGAASRDTRAAYSYAYCNLLYIASYLQSYGFVSESNYSLSFSTSADDGTEYFFAIMYSPSSYELLFGLSASSSYSTAYAFLPYDLSTGQIIDGNAQFTFAASGGEINGYSYIPVESYNQNTSLTIYSDAPADLLQDFANLSASLFYLGVVGWDSILLENISLNMGDLGFISYTTPTYNIVPNHAFDAAVTPPSVSAGGYTTYTCRYCGFSYRDQFTDPIASDTPFIDVNSSHFFYESVKWAVENQITTGTSTITFSPDEPCTRAQVVTFLWRAAGRPQPGFAMNPFVDVSAGDYFYQAVLWAVEKGITNGVSANAFGPNEACTRGQVVTFMHRYFGSPSVIGGSSFTDVAASDFCYLPVLWAVQNGITNGTSATTFSPEDTCTRGQIVTFLYRGLQ